MYLPSSNFRTEGKLSYNGVWGDEGNGDVLLMPKFNFGCPGLLVVRRRSSSFRFCDGFSPLKK